MAPHKAMHTWSFIGLMLGALMGLIFAIAYRFMFTFQMTVPWCLSLAALWVSLLWIGSLTFGTYFCISTPLASIPWAIQPITLFGVFGLEFLVVSFNAAVACLLLGESKAAKVFFIVLTLWLIVSVLQYLSYVPTKYATIAVISGPVPTREQPYTSATNDMWYKAKLIASRAQTEAIVFPEKWFFVPVTPAENAPQKCAASFASEVRNRLPDAPTVVSGCRTSGYGNFAASVFSDGTVQIYGKRRPMILQGEKSRYRTEQGIFKLVKNRHDSPFYAPLICYDLDFPSTVEAALTPSPGHTANIILSPSEDWSGVRDHYLVSVIRAIEFRVAIARADGGFNSAVIAPSGQLYFHHQTYDSTVNSQIVEVPVGDGKRSLFAIIGVYTFPIICLAAVALLLLLEFIFYFFGIVNVAFPGNRV